VNDLIVRFIHAIRCDVICEMDAEKVRTDSVRTTMDGLGTCKGKKRINAVLNLKMLSYLKIYKCCFSRTIGRKCAETMIARLIIE
jgi:hypothetical protein